MGYIIDLEKELEERLSGLDEKKKNSLIKFVKQAVVESFKNGIMLAKMGKALKDANKKVGQFKSEKR
jgi:hypothetical protein